MAMDDIISKIPFEHNDYVFESLIGSGSYGCVVKTVHSKRKHQFAAKFIYCDEKRKALLESARSEFDCLMSLFHPFVIKIYDEFKMGDFLVLILELCDENVEHFLQTQLRLNEKQLLIIMKQLITAVDYCHNNGIAHRDIKPANILIKQPGIVKLGDFGLGIIMKQGETITNYNGTFIFKAPELLKRVEHDPFKADIWSLGVTFYFIATGSYPWGTTRNEMKENILTGSFDIPYGIPSSVTQIIKKMLIVNPYKRATTAELLTMPQLLSVKLYSSLIEQKVTLSDKAPLCVRTSLIQSKTKKTKNFLSRSGMCLLSLNKRPAVVTEV